MRVAACFAALLILAACEKEKSFDQRYENVAETIENEARAIDRELENHSDGPADACIGESSGPEDRSSGC